MTKNVCVVVDPSVAKEENSKRFLINSLQEVGFKKEQVEFLLSHDKIGEAPKADYLKLYAEEALLPEIRKGKFELIIPFGNNAICALGLTPKPTGITKFRGKKAYCPDDYDIATVAIATCSVHAVMNTPQTQDSYYQDLTYAFKTLNGEIIKEQEDLEIVHMYEPRDFELMFEETLDTTKELAYDHEATGLDCFKDFVVTTCWYNGARTSTGACKGYAWAGYDQLKPLYTPTGLQEIKDVVGDILELAGTDYDLIGHNISYDDWMSEGFIGREFAGSQFDTMLMKWTVNSQRPHGLKDCTARYLGFPDYDGPMAPYLSAVKARRGKLLSVEEHADDLWVLNKFFPEVELEYKVTKKTEKFRWPKEVDKGFAMYAMVPLPTLIKYNIYDAVYTYQLKKLFEKMIDEDNLWDTYDLRHTVNRRLWKQAEQRGLLLDVERNRDFSKKLENINEKTKYQILRRTEELGFDGEFNPSSPQHVAKALFGETGTIPVIARRAFYKKYGELATDKVCDKIERELYGDMTEVKQLIRDNAFDWSEAQDELTETFIEETNWSGHIPCTSKVVGLGGLGYDPVAVTKTGQPSTSKASLITLNKGKPSDLLSLILMYKRGTKIKKDFIDKIYDTSRSDNTTSASYKVSGTECVSGDTWVSTVGGLRQMKALYDTPYDCRVWNGTGNNKKEDCYVPVSKVCHKNREGKEITLEYGFQLKGSDNHPVKTQRGFVRMDELTHDDSVEVWNGGRNCFGSCVLPRYTFNGQLKHGRISADCKLPTHITVELAEFMGMYLADGDVTFTPGQYSVRLCNQNTQIQDRFIELVELCFGLKAKVIGDTVRVSNKKLADWMIFLGMPYGNGHGMAKDKYIPDCFMACSFALIGALLKGLTLDAHGTCTKSGLAYGTQSIVMQNQIQQLLLVLGIVAYKANPPGNPIKLNISKGYLPRFLAVVGCVKDELREKLHTFVADTQSWREPIPPNAPVLLPIKKIRNWAGDVYDLSMPEASMPQYVANGMVVHNTARISSSGKFNMQNFIKQLRGQFIARVGMTFITFDYSAVEVRVMAAFSQDELLKQDLLSEDIHRAIASKIYGKAPEDVSDNERTKAKTATFLILYGGGADKLAAAFNITRTEAQSIIDSLLKVYPGIKTWMDDVIAEAAKEPYYVYTALGTRRSVKNILSNDYKEVLHAQRQAVNSIIQGTAGELMLYKICRIIDRAESKGWFDFFIAATVHDSATFEVSKKYAWNEPVLDDKGIPVLDKKGKPKLKPVGPGVDMVREVCAEPMPYEPIDTMTFPIDLQVDDFWDGEPNLTDALNGKTKEEEFRYDLIFDLQEEDEEEEELTV